MANNNQGISGVSSQLAEAVKRAKAVREAALEQSLELAQKRAAEDQQLAAKTNLNRRKGA